MTSRILLSVALVAAVNVASVSATEATETQRFYGEGSSDFGLQYYYARQDALNQAEAAGYSSSQCTEVEKVVWPYTAWVTMECTR